MLESIGVDPSNTAYSSLDGVLFDNDRTTLLRYPEGKGGDYVIPSGVDRVEGVMVGIPHFSHSAFGLSVFGHSAFRNCTGLTSVAIPAGVSVGRLSFSGCSGLEHVTFEPEVAGVGGYAFLGCESLASAVFLGDAPSLATNAFQNTAWAFTIYYLTGSSGFTSPTWNGYPAVEIDQAVYPAASWLVGQGLPYDTDLNQDPNDDGVSLLMAYALNLDPDSNVRANLPVPVIISPNTLSMSFHAASPGITYSVETSTDLRCSNSGIALSELDAENRRTASVSLDSPRRYRRLVVSENR